jgi:hypothetical protein
LPSEDEDDEEHEDEPWLLHTLIREGSVKPI